MNFPKWGDDVRFTVGEVRNGQTTAYPNADWNRETGVLMSSFVSVQSVVVDPSDRLWVLDTGSPGMAPTEFGGPKLVGIDLATDSVVKRIVFSPDVARPTTYLNDVRFDLRRGAEGTAFITDSSSVGPNGIIVVDLATGAGWRRLNNDPSTRPETPDRFVPVVEGQEVFERQRYGEPRPVKLGSDGIAISADGSRLFYCPLVSSRYYSVSVDALVNRSLGDEAVAATVVDEGEKYAHADGLESDAAGAVYFTAPQYNAIVRRRRDGQYEAVVADPRVLWPDTMSVAADGYLCFIANQLHRQAQYRNGQDRREKPYYLFRVRVDAQPVSLR